MNAWKDWIILDVYDVDWQEECYKGNYLVGNDQEWYRYAINHIVDETEPLYHSEEEARMWLYERLIMIGSTISYLPSYDVLRWK